MHGLNVQHMCWAFSMQSSETSHSSFLPGFLWIRCQPYNYPYWTLLSPATFWIDISLALAPVFPCLELVLHARRRREPQPSIHSHLHSPAPPSSSCQVTAPPIPGRHKLWCTCWKTVFTELAITSGTCNLSCHISQRKNALFQAFSVKNESCLTCICNSVFSSKLPLLGSSI